MLEHDANHKEQVAIGLELSCVLQQCACCRLLRDETGSMTSSESSFSLITSSFTQRLQHWAQPSIRDVADDYHVTIWLGDLNYRYPAALPLVYLSYLSCACSSIVCGQLIMYLSYLSDRLLQTFNQVHKKAA